MVVKFISAFRRFSVHLPFDAPTTTIHFHHRIRVYTQNRTKFRKSRNFDSLPSSAILRNHHISYTHIYTVKGGCNLDAQHMQTTNPPPHCNTLTHTSTHWCTISSSFTRRETRYECQNDMHTRTTIIKYAFSLPSHQHYCIFGSLRIICWWYKKIHVRRYIYLMVILHWRGLGASVANVNRGIAFYTRYIYGWIRCGRYKLICMSMAFKRIEYLLLNIEMRG